jgi:hypothetical protein
MRNIACRGGHSLQPAYETQDIKYRDISSLETGIQRGGQLRDLKGFDLICRDFTRLALL